MEMYTACLSMAPVAKIIVKNSSKYFSVCSYDLLKFRKEKVILFLIGVTARRDITATHPLEQQDHSAIGVAAPW